ncbi:MAG: FAD-dependent oxidoreductase, partial [Candidatus Latescibacteria bacterium]|nr:FAD-dependent oxidoreductase [Candidatus Latescibacterota bacterium]
MPNIPIAQQVDVAVVGGTIGAVAAAVAAAEAGASVFLVAPRPYLGEDLCAALRPWLEEDEAPAGPLTKTIFGDRRQATPMQVKQALDRALLDASVTFVLASYPTGVLRDAGSLPAGVVMANRAGRQAVVAKVLVDASHRGWVARMAGARCHPWPDEKIALRRTVLGGTPTTEVQPEREIPCAAVDGHEGEVYREYRLDLSLPSGDYVALAQAEQEARDLTRG